MSKREEVPVKWDKDKKWEELKEIKSVYVKPGEDITAKPGIRYFMSENGGSKQPFSEEIAAMVISILFSGVVAILTVLGIVAYYSKKARIILLISLLTLLIPCKVYDVNVMKWKIWNCLYDYFSYSLIFDAEFDIKQKYLFAEYPHGTVPMGCIISGFAFPHFSPETPFPSFHSLTTKSALMIPFYGMILKWMGSIPASRGNIRKALATGSCAVVVDGIAGMYVNEPHKEMIKFSGRLGFIRAAVETGTPIRPVYQFGTSQIMKLIPKCFESFARKFSCATGLMIGRWNLPIPKKVMLMSVVGGVVEVKKMDKNDPQFDAYVNEVQQKVADEIQRVYYKYRGIYGWSERPLELY